MLISTFKLVLEILLGSFSTEVIQLGPCMLQSGIIAIGSTVEIHSETPQFRGRN
jgi:hypothetical protein